MTRRSVYALIFCTLPPVASAQALQQATYDSAYFAWDTGDYPTALATFVRLLESSDGEVYLDDIAFLTGERYTTTEIAIDGTAPAWSPDGRIAAYETPSSGPTRTHLFSLGGSSAMRVATLEGTRAAFSLDGGQVAYLVLGEGPELDAARAEVQRGIQVRSFADFRRVRSALARVDAAFTSVHVHDMMSGEGREMPAPGLAVFGVAYGDGGLYILGSQPDGGGIDVYALAAGAAPHRLTTDPGTKTDLRALPGTGHLLYAVDGTSMGLLNVATGEVRRVSGSAPGVSADGSTVAFVGRDGEENTINVMRVDSEPVEVVRTRFRVDNPALSPNGDRVVYQIMPRENWELMVAGADGSDPRMLTREIQHDLFPRFVDDETVLAVIGEGRHRRSHLYDVTTGRRTRLFHNNTVRTVAPEYEWTASPDGSNVLIVSERDGDTISPERALYVVDLDRRLTKDDVLARLRISLAAERDLRERGRRMFAEIASDVTATVADISTARIYRYEQDLFAFGSKHITQPGNAKAIEYIAEQLRSFGYEPEPQWFEPRPGIRSANVIATLPGTRDPDLIYIVSSHFDSVERGPGADDNTSGTTALLEAARVLANHPQPTTLKFALFTGEEAGLLGSREYVRRAVEADDKIVGALNNDMIGFANDHRLDNTIRYSNAGIRDVQHSAAFLFSDLITFDAKYYKSTDAHAYYEAYGDIVGGIGSYPILGNPHYHQTHDVLETINHQLVAEVSKTTVATLMLLASSPSRLTGLELERRGGDVAVRWDPAVESDVDHYVVSYGADGTRSPRAVTTRVAEVVLIDVEPGMVVSVKAVNRRDMEGWDWVRTVVR